MNCQTVVKTVKLYYVKKKWLIHLAFYEKSICCKLETLTTQDVIYLRKELIVFFVRIYYSELLKLKNKIMKKLTIMCKYIHIYIH